MSSNISRHGTCGSPLRAIARQVLCLFVVVALLFLAPSGCGSSACEDLCEGIREKLINNFGIDPADIDCSAPEWDDADTCEKCQQLVRAKYSVYPVSCTGYF